MRKHFSFPLALLFSLSSHLVLANTELTVVYTLPSQTAGTILQEFGRSTGIKVTAIAEDEADAKAKLLSAIEENTTPDAIIAPADHIGLYKFVKYSEIDRALFKANIPERIWKGGVSDGTLYGAPLVQGNHLMLFYNKALVKQPAADWDEMYRQKAEFEPKGIITIAWNYDTAYFLLPFLGAYGGSPIKNGEPDLNTPAMAAALSFYRGLYVNGLVHPNCNYLCTVALFKTGKLAYTINGDWASQELHSALGENLGVAAMPMAEGRKLLPVFSTHVIAFPNNSLNGKKRKALIQLVNYLQSPAGQRRMWELGGFTPVESSALVYAQKNAKGYLKQTLELMHDTQPIPADQIMSFIWYAINKGIVRHRNSALNGPDTAKYIQLLAERHIRNAQSQTQPHEKSGVKNPKTGE